MALTCSLCFQPHLLALVLIMVSDCFVAETAALIHLKGEVGRNVTFHCQSDKDRAVKFFYFQKGDTFVNGYHATKEVNNTWNNTRVDRNASSVHMENLNISHAGDYQCYIFYTDSDKTVDTLLHLDVTGTYSKPEVKVNCSGTSSCAVTCVSHGGYPGTDVIWNDPGNPMRNFTNATNSRMSDPHTKLITSSSTANFSCTKGELKLTCSVGGITSDMFSVCAIENSPEPSNFYLILSAAAVAVVVAVIAVALVLWKVVPRKSHGDRAAEGERTERGVSRPEEEVTLNENESREETC